MHTFTIAFVGTQYKKEGKCRFKASKILSSSHGYYFFVLKKGSWYTQKFSRGWVHLDMPFITRYFITMARVQVHGPVGEWPDTLLDEESTHYTEGGRMFRHETQSFSTCCYPIVRFD